MAAVVLVTGSVSPAADTVETLARVPTNRVLPPCTVRVNNAGDEDYSFQCFRAPLGAAHSEAHALGPLSWIAAGAIVQYQIPEFCGSRDVIRVRTSCPDQSVTFSISAPLVS